MACIREVSVLELTAEWLQQPVKLENWVTVGERRYIRLQKSDRKIERALCGESPGKRRLITGTTIIEDLTKLRNEAHHRASREVELGRVEDDLGFDEAAPPPKRARRSKVSLPDSLDIVAPPQGATEGTTVRVLTAGGFEPLWLELSETAINYLRAAVVNQVADDSIVDPSEKAHPSPSPGVYWSTKKASWRVRVNEEGKQKTRFFKPEEPGDDSAVASAASDAAAFLEAHT